MQDGFYFLWSSTTLTGISKDDRMIGRVRRNRHDEGNMKSITKNILLMFMCCTSAAEGQVLKAYALKFGTVAASQSFKYTIPFSLSTDIRWGFDIGGFVELFDSQYFSVQPEIHYIQKGYSITARVTTEAQPDGPGYDITFRPRVDYLSIPVLIKVRFETHTVIPYLCIGPRFDLLLPTHDKSFNYSSTDIGATMVGGFQFSIVSDLQFLIEGRFSPSLANAFQNENLTVKNKSFEILLGATF